MLSPAKNVEYYGIYETCSEYNGAIRECYDTKEEAESHIMEFADWYCHKGTCSIKHFRTDPKFGVICVETWDYNEGKFVKHWDF